MNRLALPTILLLLLGLAACATDTALEGTPEGDYAKARAMLDRGDYAKAHLFLDKYASHHPYSQYTVRADILRAFAAYKAEEYVAAGTICEEFIRRHPRHRDVAYARYLLGMAHYQQVVPPEKDQSESRLAIEAFRKLIEEHPDSPYARDAANRLQKLYNHLAEHELVVGRFYFERERFVAAANRFQGVVSRYQTTSAIEEALYYLAASYAALGVRDSAADTARILRHNYPDGAWSARAARFL